MNKTVRDILSNPLPATGPLRIDFDICQCGDFRRDHIDGTGRWQMPNDINHGYKPCEKFKFSHVSSDEEIAKQLAIIAACEAAPEDARPMKDEAVAHTELKPCPFCPDSGSPALSDPDWEQGYQAFVAVECKKCGVRGRVVTFHIMNQCGGLRSEWRRPFEDQAIAAWNTRASLPVVEKMAEALKSFVDYYDQAGIGECLEEHDDDENGQFDGDEAFNVRHGRAALAAYKEMKGEQ